MSKQIYREWYEALSTYLRRHINAGETVVVIALSRKMPRLIQWICKNALTEDEACQLWDLLYNNPLIHYTTELAIPFVFSDPEMLQASVMILDDIVISGDTIGGVMDEIYLLTGDLPDTLSLYEYSRQSARYLHQTHISDQLPVKINNMNEARAISRELAGNVIANGLPIDVEFPIEHVDQGPGIYQLTVSSIKDSGLAKRSYLLGGNMNQSFTIIVDDHKSRAYNNDFTKIRLFKTDKGVRIVAYSPNIISESRLKEASLFENAEYRRLWEMIVNEHLISDPVKYGAFDLVVSEYDEQRHRVHARICKSLTMMANYLCSLSALVRWHKEYHISALVTGTISLTDLQLLTGGRLARKMIGTIREIMSGNIQSSSKQYFSETSDHLAPTGMLGQYNYLRAVALVKSSTVDSALTEIFNIGYSLGTSYEKRRTLTLEYNDNHYCMETYQSLYSLPKVMFHDQQGEDAVNKVIDRLIDSGMVVPIYARTTDEGGNYYWRRFFRPSHIISEANRPTEEE